MHAETILDGFEDISAWTVFASGQAQLTLQHDRRPGGNAMRLDFDFQGGGGFVVVRRPLPLQIPESYAFSFTIRGEAPPNIFEFKLADAANVNVWRYRVEAFKFPRDWQDITIRSTQIEFAWGPLGGGPARDIAALEIVIAAGSGGKGSVWIGALRFSDTTYRLTPIAQASSFLPEHEPCHIFDADEATAWRSLETDDPQWLQIDFQALREYGGLAIVWEPGRQARQFRVLVSDDAEAWRMVYVAQQAGAARSYIFMPQTSSRFIRLELLRSARETGFGIRHLAVKPFDFSRSVNHFFQNIARESFPGSYPRYLLGTQSYWTPVGTGSSTGQALINEEGMVEVGKGLFSLEPFLFCDNRLITWNEAKIEQELARNRLPVPTVTWHGDGLVLAITAAAAEIDRARVLLIRYRIRATDNRHQTVALFVAIRPFQVTPVWQHWRAFGGVAAVREIAWRDDTVVVNGAHVVVPVTAPSAFGAAAFDEGSISDHISRGALPDRTVVNDEFGYASAALRYDLALAPQKTDDVYLAVPLDENAASALRIEDPEACIIRTLRRWDERLSAVSLRLPPEAHGVADSFATAAAHILINRDGPALHPGPRRYARSWIRDGVIMGAALARAGCPEALRDFMRWYARFQTPDGNIPDCADEEGTEWLPEYDAYGQFIYGCMEYYRFTKDRGFLEELHPAVQKTLAYMETLRSRRMTPEYRSGEKRACYGLLPESMSHEGYMAHPVHAYWDDFWAIRGLRDAADMAAALGDSAEAHRRRELCRAMSKDVAASLRATISRYGIDHVPGSVEFGDFDPTATSNAIGLLDLLPLLPLPETHCMYDRYLEGLRRRVAGTDVWNNYTAYEIRIVGALVRLGRRGDALDLLRFLLNDQRIPAWHQWPEITWRDARGPSFLGDLPHTWISAEYMLSVCSLFAYERGSDQSLVIAAGVAPEWLSGGRETGVDGMPTHYGTISYSLTAVQPGMLRLRVWGDTAIPPGGIVARPPLSGPITEFSVNGSTATDFTAEEGRIRTCPAEATIFC